MQSRGKWVNLSRQWPKLGINLFVFLINFIMKQCWRNKMILSNNLLYSIHMDLNSNQQYSSPPWSHSSKSTAPVVCWFWSWPRLGPTCSCWGIRVSCRTHSPSWGLRVGNHTLFQSARGHSAVAWGRTALLSDFHLMKGITCLPACCGGRDSLASSCHPQVRQGPQVLNSPQHITIWGFSPFVRAPGTKMLGVYCINKQYFY